MSRNSPAPATAVRSGLERTCKPGSVTAAVRRRMTAISLGHRLPDASSSRPGSGCEAGRLAPPTAPRRCGRTSSCLALLPMGFAEPDRSPGLLVSSYLTVSPLPTATSRRRRFTFCGTVPGLAAGGRYPPSCPAEPGLSSRRWTDRSRSHDRAATGGRPVRSSRFVGECTARRNLDRALRSPYARFIG